MGLFSCSKAQNDYLKDFGYATLALPKASVQPLLMMTSNGKILVPAGPLAASFNAGAVPLPAINRARAGSISGSKSKSLKIDVGLNLLGSVIGALAGSSLGLKAAYQKASNVEYEFGDVFEKRADFNALDSFLAAASEAAGMGPAMKMLFDRDEIYVLTAIIETSSISVKASASSGKGVSLDVPMIQGVVGGEVGVKSASSDNSVIKYSATNEPLTIGAELVRLSYRRDKTTGKLVYELAKQIKSGDKNLGLAAGAPGADKGGPAVYVPKGGLML